VFDSLTELAAKLCGTSMAVLTFLDERRQWFKSRVGITLTETPREIAFCAHTVEGAQLFERGRTSGSPFSRESARSRSPADQVLCRCAAAYRRGPRTRITCGPRSFAQTAVTRAARVATPPCPSRDAPPQTSSYRVGVQRALPRAGRGFALVDDYGDREQHISLWNSAAE